MLIQKKTNTKRIIIVLIIVALVGAIYFIFMGQGKEETEDLFSFSVPNDLTRGKIKLDLTIFQNPYFLSLVDRTEGRYSAQYSILARGDNYVLEPSETKVFDPATGEKLIVAWQNPSKAYQFIRIYRSELSGQLGEVIADNLKGVESYEDLNVERTKEYYYTVKAVGENGQESKNTKQVLAKPSDRVAPATVGQVTLKNVLGKLAVEITWQDPRDSDFDRVKIYRSQTQGVLGSLLVDQKPPENKYVDEQVEEGQTYYYTISSQDKSGNESLFNMVPAAGNTFIFQPVITE